MPTRSQFGPPAVAAIVVLAALGVAGPAAAVPPTISGADGDLWSVAPSYTVSATAPVAARARWDWRASNGQDGRSTQAPFTITLDRLFEEGPATLTVTQTRGGLGIAETATRSFTIDRTPPAAVALGVPATAAAGTDIPISWTAGEPGGRFTLRVRRATGEVVQGPVDTVAASARITPLEPGSYEVGVVQTDGAGNAGPEALAPLAIPVPAVPAFTPPLVQAVAAAATKPTRPSYQLPARNAARLTPRRGARITARRPVLRWPRGTARTQLYNVQLFRVVERTRTASRAPLLRKVQSSFPRDRRLRTVPLARGACYVWRVWPYAGSGFTAEPLGLSSFCVVGARL